jgi:hypothetical protein
MSWRLGSHTSLSWWARHRTCSLPRLWLLSPCTRHGSPRRRAHVAVGAAAAAGCAALHAVRRWHAAAAKRPQVAVAVDSARRLSLPRSHRFARSFSRSRRFTRRQHVAAAVDAAWRLSLPRSRCRACSSSRLRRTAWCALARTQQEQRSRTLLSPLTRHGSSRRRAHVAVLCRSSSRRAHVAVVEAAATCCAVLHAVRC